MILSILVCGVTQPNILEAAHEDSLFIGFYAFSFLQVSKK